MGWYTKRLWRDLLSVYYANTPTWRWLKSGALVFLGFFLWTGGSVLLSVQPEWTILHYPMAYGFLLIVWGPLTHFVVVPFTIRLRRAGQHPLARLFARNSGKINLTVFFTLVVLFGAFTPGIMMLEFTSVVQPGGSTDVRGELVCDVDEVVACQIENAAGFDHIVVTSGGEPIATVEEPPYAFEIHPAELEETRTGKEFSVDYRNEAGETIKREIRSVHI